MAYHDARERACASQDGGDVLEGLNQWDVARLLQALAPQVKEDDIKNKHVMHAYWEVLMRPKLLNIGEMNQVFANNLKNTLQNGQLTFSNGQWLPGMYYLCGHPDDKVRAWAREQVVGLGIIQDMSTFLELASVLEDFITALEHMALEETLEADEQQDACNIKPALSRSFKELFAGLSTVVRKIHPHLLSEHFLQRFPSVLELTTMTIVESNPALLPALHTLSFFLSSLSHQFWSACSFRPPFIRTLVQRHVLQSGSPPIQRAALEVLEQLAYAVSGDTEIRQETTQETVAFLCCEEVKSALPRGMHDLCTLICARTLDRQLHLGGLASLPFALSDMWGQRIAIVACTPGLPDAMRVPPARFVAGLMLAQAHAIDQQEMDKGSSSTTDGASKSAPHQRDSRGKSVENEGDAMQESLAPGCHDAPNGVSHSFTRSVWEWALKEVGVSQLTREMHGAALLAAGALLCYAHNVQPNEASSSCAPTPPSTSDGSQEPLRHMQALLLPYLDRLALSAVDVALPTNLVQDRQFSEALFELCVLPQNTSRDSVQQFLARAFGNSVGVGYALHDATSRDVYAVARGCARALRRISSVGVTGHLFNSLQHVFLYAGQILPLIFSRVDEPTKVDICGLVWRVSEAFIRARSYYRSEDFMRDVPSSVFDATAARFFAFFRSVWPSLQHSVITAGQNSTGQNLNSTVASSHAEWLPALGRWGGISSVTVRRHWCDCITLVLRDVNGTKASSSRLDEARGLTKSELAVFEKLLARKDLWTDDQMLALGRELGQVRVGNLGALPLANLPMRKRAQQAHDGGKEKSKKARSGDDDASYSDGVNDAHTRSFPGRSVDHEKNSGGGNKAKSAPAFKPLDAVGLANMIAAEFAGSNSLNGSNGQGSVTVRVGASVFNLPVSGNVENNNRDKKTGLKMSRRWIQSQEELEKDLHSNLLLWDVFAPRRRGVFLSVIYGCMYVKFNFDAINAVYVSYGCSIFEVWCVFECDV
jgi:hypothetical protein